MTRNSRSVAVAVTALVVLGVALTGCGSGSSKSGTNAKSITVWSLENQTDRFTKTQQIAKDFTAKTGISVSLQAVDENQLPQLIVQGAQAGKLPDVVGGASLATVQQLATQKLLDTTVAGNVVSDLKTDTFTPAALALTKSGDTQLAVPSDAWAQILVYRDDLLKKAGLQPPTTYDTLLKAAQTLTSGKQYGITLATDPADVFTEQTFESLALGNECQLVDKSGKVTLDSPQCVKTFDLYQQLSTKNSPKGTQTVDSTRASYFAGQSAMVIWSTFLLDEMAGLRNDALPTCPQCKSDKQFLSKNSGIIASIPGPDSKNGGAFGEIGSWAAISGKNADGSKQFIEYMLSDGYTGWLGLAPEGKFPVRQGDASDPKKYVNAWTKLPAGVDVKKPLSEVYPADTIKQMVTLTEHIDRWAIPQGQGNLLGAINAQLTISKVIAEMASSGEDGAAAAAQAQAAVVKVQSKLKK